MLVLMYCLENPGVSRYLRYMTRHTPYLDFVLRLREQFYLPLPLWLFRIFTITKQTTSLSIT